VTAVAPLSEDAVQRWVSGYVQAWRTGDAADIAAIFEPDAESHEWPYETHWTGLAEITEGWQARQHWQDGGWEFTWRLLHRTGDTFAVQGLGVYRELGTFDNLWVTTLGSSGRASVFRMWNNEVDA
jgi:ketosteroid isomerase-like protein